jgi:hypothetical protein
MIELEGLDQVSQNRLFGKLYLIDLAGSERVKETGSSGQRLVEATYINQSLSALGDVMTALSNPKKQAHIPYRNSKLTYLLQDCLGGNSKTMMFVNISPADKHAQETMCSLQFARRVRTVRLTASASVENAALTQYKLQAEQVGEEKKQVEARMQRQLAKLEQAVKDRDAVIADLKEQLKGNTMRLTQMEVQKRKEMADLANKLEQEQKAAGRSDSKRVDPALQKKMERLQEQYEQVQKLLKLSQRENKSLKEALEQGKGAPAAPAAQRDRALEEKMDELNRRARAEALARKRAEEAGEQGKRVLAKELEDKEQLIRLLREKNRKLELDLQKLRTQSKRERVNGLIVESRVMKPAKVHSRPPTETDLRRAGGGGGGGGGAADSSPPRPPSAPAGPASARQHRASIESNDSSSSSQSGLQRPRKWSYVANVNALKSIIADPAAREADSSAPNTRPPSTAGQRYRDAQRALIARRSISRTTVENLREEDQPASQNGSHSDDETY